MITRSEVVKLLMEEIDRCRRAPDLNGCEMREEWQRTIDVCRIAVNAILEQEERRWIPVTERLPEIENGRVLMSDGEKCYLAPRSWMHKINGIDGFFIPANHGAGARITHWMPLQLPELKKENA